MKTTLYYFSATGNCLTTTQLLAQELGDCQLKPATAYSKQSKVKEDAERIGILCPVYYGTMPYPVRELLCKLVFTAENPYIFLLTTCKGHAGAIAQRCDQLLRCRGQKLSWAGNIPMPGNSFMNKPGEAEIALANQKENLLPLVEELRNKTVQEIDSRELLPLQPVYYPNNFRAILAEDNCIGCGTCVKVCPMDNISLKDGHAIIGDDCATCLACFHWCPVEAICMSKQEGIERRPKYHHPDVTLADIIAQKQL
ncbi:MAG: EFR1 family ferrodoxin [Oscillospiraceae bacterium]|nr:EFR1 family ferrodoxin [Oscillospiraceae bacterium]